MGADFLERTKKTIKRSWDRERVALATSDLLTRQPDCAGARLLVRSSATQTSRPAKSSRWAAA
jgi:hypothetical protein